MSVFAGLCIVGIAMASRGSNNNMTISETIVENAMAQDGIVTIPAIEPKNKEVQEDASINTTTVRRLNVKSDLADVVTITNLEWKYSGIKINVTTTAYPPDEDGDYQYSDGSHVRSHHYTIAVSRDLEKFQLTDGRIINLKEKILDPRGTGRMVYRWGIYIPGYGSLDHNKYPDPSKLAFARDRTPRTVWIDAQGAKKFGKYQEWRSKDLFLDARPNKHTGRREVRVKADKWVDVLYTHPGNYSSIRARCRGEWGKLHPDHMVNIYLFELKEVARRIMLNNGEVAKLGGG
jgi:hypothetical protein